MARFESFERRIRDQDGSGSGATALASSRRWISSFAELKADDEINEQLAAR